MHPLNQIQKRLSDIRQRMEFLQNAKRFPPNKAFVPERMRDLAGLSSKNPKAQLRIETQSDGPSQARKSLADAAVKKTGFSEQLEGMIESESRRAGVNPDLIRAIVRTRA